MYRKDELIEVNQGFGELPVSLQESIVKDHSYDLSEVEEGS